MEHQRKYCGSIRGNPGDAESADSQDTSINMPVSMYSCIFNLVNSSIHCSASKLTLTGRELDGSDQRNGKYALFRNISQTLQTKDSETACG